MTEVAVVIPAYRVRNQILSVLERVGPEVSFIFVVDDACPENSGEVAEAYGASDPRVTVLRHEENAGVGGAVMTGYRAALDAGATIVVKVDGDGQMDPRLIPRLIRPILLGDADYAKGNRFHSLYDVRAMPVVRLLGNAVLGFLTKLSSGYWRVFDPTNGFTAIHEAVLRRVNLDNVSRRYFFETDMLINLGGLDALVVDVPMEAVYADEQSSLRIRTVASEFLRKHLRYLVRRVFYGYFLRDFSLASVHLVLGLLMVVGGGVWGALAWRESIQTGVVASTGTVMLSVLPIILGTELLLSFLAFDISRERTIPLHRYLAAPESREVPPTADPGP